MQQRGFSRAGLADQRDDLALVRTKRPVAEDDELAPGLLVNARDAIEPKRRIIHSGALPPDPSAPAARTDTAWRGKTIRATSGRRPRLRRDRSAPASG